MRRKAHLVLHGIGGNLRAIRAIVVSLALSIAALLLFILLAALPSPASAREPSPAPPPQVMPAAATFPGLSAPDPIVSVWLEFISTSVVTGYVAGLSGERPILIGGAPYTLTTRHTDSQEPIGKAIDYVEEHMQGLGLAVTRHTWHATRPPNLIGQITGLVQPDAIYIISAHLDNMPPGSLAPGADDNASGVTAVLAAADILSAYRWGCTLRFALWTGEEQGLLGSQVYATAARAANEEIAGVLNFDMIGWNTPGSPPDIDLHAASLLPPTLELARLLVDVIDVYDLDLIPQVIPDGIGGSDHASFWRQGYPALLAIEDYFPNAADFNPGYHTVNDRLAQLDVAYFTDFVRAAVAGFAHMSDCLLTGALQGNVTRRLDASPLPGATITMTHASGHVYTTTVDATGRYTFTLPAGNYRVSAGANGLLSAAPITVAVATDEMTTQDFALAGGALVVAKTLAIADPVRPGQALSFTVRIANDTNAPIVSLSLADSYPSAFLSYVTSQPPADDALDDGMISWGSLATPIAPGAAITVTTTFLARQDTTFLPGSAAQNTATVSNALADADGDGPQPPAYLPSVVASATVRILTPTAATVNGFSAMPQPGRVFLRWQTMNEVAIAGFRLLRTTPDAGVSLVTPEAIPATHAGSAQGADYTFGDDAAAPNLTHIYLLQIVQLDGSRVTVAVAAASPRPAVFLPIVVHP